MALPCLDALLDTGTSIVVCARPWASDLLAAYPVADFLPMQASWRANRSQVSLHRRQARHKPAYGLLLPDSIGSAFSFRFAGLDCAGYRDEGRSLILRWPCRKPPRQLHAVQSWYYLTRFALGKWGLPSPAPEPASELGWLAADLHESQAAQALSSAGLEDGAFVLIAPTATGLHKGKVKVWPGFATLVNQLHAHGIKVAMSPPAAERKAAMLAAPGAIMLPELGLGAFAALTRRARLVVCNDSGVSHLAAAARARQITLFGVTDPARTGPWSNNALRLGQSGAWPSNAMVLAASLEIYNQDMNN